jgi:hypothetical protein
MFHIFCLVLALTAGPPTSFHLLDVDSVDGRPLNRYRPLDLGPSAVRPIAWDVAPPHEIQHGLLLVGPNTDSALAAAWDRSASVLWIDADADRRFSRDECHEIEAGPPIAIPVSIGATEPVRRTILVRPGLLGGGPRYTVRGAMAGELEMAGRRVHTMLIDGNADGCFDEAGTDRVWVDLNGDGQFDSVAEQYPLGAPIRVGDTAYIITSDPWAHEVAAHERDTRDGCVRLSLGSQAIGGKVLDLSANLVSQIGELVTVSSFDAPTEAPVGLYRVAGVSLQLAETSGRVWSYTFSGGRKNTIEVRPGVESCAELFNGLTLDVTAAVHSSTRPGDEIDVTPHLQLASGLYLSLPPGFTWRTARPDWARRPATSSRAGPQGLR